MPKKGPGAGGSKKGPVPPASNEDDGSYIVFGHGKSDKGKKKGDADAGARGKDDGTPAPEHTPKNPDTRQLIGGTSWTGKLPVNMLSEHCQKQKWAKPEYTMVCELHCLLLHSS